VITKPVVVLFSGGVDSLAALVFARECYGPDNVLAVYCDVGHRYRGKEIKAVETICKMLKQDYVIENRLFLGDLELPPEQNALIPYRNSFFILLAGLHVSDKNGLIMLQNIVAGESSTWDRRPEFNNVMSDLLHVADPKQVRLKAPHQGKTKTEIFEYLKEKVSKGVIFRTVGCYSPEHNHCGQCSSCLRRAVALWNADLKEGLDEYANDIREWDGIQGYIERMKQGVYDQSRVDETFKAFKEWGIRIW